MGGGIFRSVKNPLRVKPMSWAGIFKAAYPERTARHEAKFTSFAFGKVVKQTIPKRSTGSGRHCNR